MSTQRLRDELMAWVSSCSPANLTEAVLLDGVRQLCERSEAAEEPPKTAPRAQGWPDGMDEMAAHAVEQKGMKK